WKPTRSIDVKLKAESIVTQAVDTDATGIRADAVQIGVDYEFRRNVVLSLAAIYEKDRFVGQFRTDKVYSTLVEIKYLFNRHWSISA
ncbi:outer membrane beta-barrel protein, partial [Salmonella enterica]|uniref:outer membrane beta-barrel protein n=1 Tax=Salmonella enterica TaxID=28901 RepID=UPI0018799BC3